MIAKVIIYMQNNTLEQLVKIINSDDYDLESGTIIKKLQAKWDLAEAAENLSHHLVIKDFLRDLEEAVALINQLLLEQKVASDAEIKYRFKLQADKECYNRFLSIFNGRNKQILDQRIQELKAKADMNVGNSRKTL